MYYAELPDGIPKFDDPSTWPPLPSPTAPGLAIHASPIPDLDSTNAELEHEDIEHREQLKRSVDCGELLSLGDDEVISGTVPQSAAGSASECLFCTGGR